MTTQPMGKKKTKKAPSPVGRGIHARNMPVGTYETGADGLYWIVARDKNGRHFWKVKQTPISQRSRYLRAIVMRMAKRGPWSRIGYYRRSAIIGEAQRQGLIARGLPRIELKKTIDRLWVKGKLDRINRSLTRS